MVLAYACSSPSHWGAADAAATHTPLSTKTTRLPPAVARASPTACCICHICPPAGAKVWAFLSNLDNDFVDAAGKTVPPGLSTQRLFGPEVTCGRFARLFVSVTVLTTAGARAPPVEPSVWSVMCVAGARGQTTPGSRLQVAHQTLCPLLNNNPQPGQPGSCPVCKDC